jgi:hypothetical protein
VKIVASMAIIRGWGRVLMRETPTSVPMTSVAGWSKRQRHSDPQFEPKM